MTTDVATLLTTAQNNATFFVTQAQTAMAAGIGAINSMGFTGFAFNPPTDVDAPVVPDPLVAPVLQDFDLVLPATPGAALVFQDIPPIDQSGKPIFTDEAPTLTTYTAPTALAPLGLAPPTIQTDFPFPVAPEGLTNPDLTEPVIADRAAPARPTIALPSFDATLPTNRPQAPQNLQATFETAYATMSVQMRQAIDARVRDQLATVNPEFDAQMTRLEARLVTMIEGGTGIPVAYEDAIAERTRERADAEAQKVADTAIAEGADRGWTMPGGAQFAALVQGRQDAANTIAAANRELAIKRVEQEQEAIRFAVTQSQSLRTAMLQYSLGYAQNLITLNGQGIEFSKFIITTLIDTFNVAREVYAMDLEAYKAEASVYEVKLKGALALKDIYLADIQALEALTQVDRTRLEVYKARIGIVEVLANVYRSQIEAVQGRASLEKLKLELFGSQVQLYQAEGQAKQLEVEIFKANMEGNMQQVRLLEAKAGVFNSRVTAWKATIEGQAEAVRAASETNRGRADMYRAQWDGFGTQVRALGDVARTRLENEREKVIGFTAQSNAQVADFTMRSEFYKAQSGVARDNARLTLEAMYKSAEDRRGFGTTLANLYQAIAAVEANLAGSAMAGVTALVGQTLVQ